MEALIAGLKVSENKHVSKTQCLEYTQLQEQFQNNVAKVSKLQTKLYELPETIIANQDLIDRSLEQVNTLHRDCLAEIQKCSLEFQQKIYALNTNGVNELVEARLNVHKLAFEVNQLQAEIKQFEQTGTTDLKRLNSREQVAKLFGLLYCDSEFGSFEYKPNESVNSLEFEEYSAADSSLVLTDDETTVIEIRSKQTQLNQLVLKQPTSMQTVIAKANKPDPKWLDSEFEAEMLTTSVFDKFPGMKKILNQITAQNSIDPTESN